MSFPLDCSKEWTVFSLPCAVSEGGGHACSQRSISGDMPAPSTDFEVSGLPIPSTNLDILTFQVH